ncbi:MAG: peptide chain release factor N(5)-glutamine methyltransferase [Thermaerobacter sp.]|nr:peptide chain release factor N(5)-glutamine methyltransferase [Thermaerobacter sp.]
MTVGEALAAGTRRVGRREAALLLQHAARRSALELVTRLDAAVPPRSVGRFLRGLDRRAAGEPLQYVLGEWEFWSLPLRVDRRALIPRPETELLVEEALRLAPGLPKRPVLVDMGTGSGCLAVALARELPAARILAVDLSAPALDLARANARRHGAGRRITFLRGDLFAALPAGVAADLILSNPPYVPSGELAAARELAAEPALALDGGPDGLALLRCLAREAVDRLVPGGYLLLEVGDGQAERVCRLLAQGGWEEVGAVGDLAGTPRVVRGRRPGSGAGWPG